MIFQFTVPSVPPSVNHYVKHTRRGGHYVSKEALAFKRDVGIFSRGAEIKAEAYEIEIVIFLGAKKSGDLDNFAKVCLDGLKEAHVITSDAKVTDLHLHKRRDNDNPRTEISISDTGGG